MEIHRIWIYEPLHLNQYFLFFLLDLLTCIPIVSAFRKIIHTPRIYLLHFTRNHQRRGTYQLKIFFLHITYRKEFVCYVNRSV